MLTMRHPALLMLPRARSVCEKLTAMRGMSDVKAGSTLRVAMVGSLFRRTIIARVRTAGMMRRMQAQMKETTRPYGTKQRSSACCTSALD